MNIMKKPIQTRSAVRTLRLAFLAPGALAFAFLALAAPHARATTLTAPDGAANDEFGFSVNVSGDNALVGAFANDEKASNAGAAWYYKGLDGKSGTVNESVKLLASDGAADDWFGRSVSVSGDSALAGARTGDGNVANTGSAYYFKGLDNATDPTVNQDVKLLASDGAANDEFGYSVSLSGDSALVGARYDDDKGANSGSAYYYKGLDNAISSGTKVVNESVKLIASDGALNDYFGHSVSLSGDRALVGAYGDADKGSVSGSAYYYKGLDSAVLADTKVVEQSVKLIASDCAAQDYFGHSVSLSGDRALVGADLDDDKGSSSGAAYYYKGLDGKTGRPTDYTGPASVTTATYQDVKLLASDGAAGDYFGRSVSLSGDSALVGANRGDGNVADTGAAYYFKGLDGKTGLPDGYTGPASVTTATYESVKLLASDGAASDNFGWSVSLEGDRFVIGASQAQVGTATSAGKAYGGDIRAFTTLDAGSTALATDGLSFVSQGDWVIGATTSGNAVTLSRVWNTTLATAAFVSDTATVTATGKAVYIGQNAGANDNVLIIEGTLVAREVNIGFEDQTTGNTLRLTTAALATLDIDTLFLGAGNFIEAEGSGYALADVLTLLTGTTLSAWDGTTYTQVDTGNIGDLLAFVDLGNGYAQWTTIATSSVPEPATYAALAGLALLAWAALRRSGNRVTRG
ncbi:hypothetical protein OpiT1DRAFT_05585 [Opitutaceae bacterium TAV1]|nr:hypothetical protein OpiT1DRAFT_05585 [Opitutaceae bacterium TAV1]